MPVFLLTRKKSGKVGRQFIGAWNGQKLTGKGKKEKDHSKIHKQNSKKETKANFHQLFIIPKSFPFSHTPTAQSSITQQQQVIQQPNLTEIKVSEPQQTLQNALSFPKLRKLSPPLTRAQARKLKEVNTQNKIQKFQKKPKKL